MSNTKRKIYFSILVLGLSVVVFFLIVIPATSKIKTISNDIQSQKIKLEAVFLKGQLLKPTKKQYEKIEPQISELTKIYVMADDELELIKALENTATQNNIEHSINLKQNTLETNKKKKDKEKERLETKNYQILALSMEVSGNYENFIKYLSDLEALDYYIKINNIRIFGKQSGMPESSKNSINALIQAECFLINHENEN